MLKAITNDITVTFVLLLRKKKAPISIWNNKLHHTIILNVKKQFTIQNTAFVSPTKQIKVLKYPSLCFKR